MMNTQMEATKMLEIFLLMVNVKENKKLNKEALDMQKYRNDYKYAKEHKFIPHVDLPNWMKQSKRLQLLIATTEKFNDDGK